MNRCFLKCIIIIISICIGLSVFSGCSEKEEISNVPSQTELHTQINSETNETKSDFSSLPTNTHISFRFIDYKQFSQWLTDGVYRCGTDFSAGDYYILSIFDAEAIYDVRETPNGFTWSHYRMIRKLSVEDGQYVKIPSGGLLIHSDEFDTKHIQNYGIFLVGKDLPEGDYKIVSLENAYHTDIANVSGISGAYQISEGFPENDPIECSPLFEKQTYITVKNGQYITINNAEMIYVG